MQETLENLELRAKPRPVVKLKKSAVILSAGGVCLFILLVLMIGLQKPDRSPMEAKQLYSVEHKAKPDVLEDLPKSYSEVEPIKLGPPLPGDLGSAVTQMETSLGIDPSSPLPISEQLETLSTAENDLLRAERIREARRQIQARESSVFFEQNAGRKAATETVMVTSTEFDPALEQLLALTAENGVQSEVNAPSLLDRATITETANGHSLTPLASPYSILAGTIIPASLITGINSDLPGLIIAQVSEPVLDTVTGEHLLIPQGSRLIGRYESVVAYGQERALLVWQRLIRPDGSSLVLDNLPATDLAGYAGLEDEVDHHSWKLLKGIALSTMLGVGTELSFGSDESDLVGALRESTQDTAARVGERIVDRNLSIQPTITIRPGWPLRVIVHKDLILLPDAGEN